MRYSNLVGHKSLWLKPIRSIDRSGYFFDEALAVQRMNFNDACQDCYNSIVYYEMHQDKYNNSQKFGSKFITFLVCLVISIFAFTFCVIQFGWWPKSNNDWLIVASIFLSIFVIVFVIRALHFHHMDFLMMTADNRINAHNKIWPGIAAFVMGKGDKPDEVYEEEDEEEEVEEVEETEEEEEVEELDVFEEEETTEDDFNPDEELFLFIPEEDPDFEEYHEDASEYDDSEGEPVVDDYPAIPLPPPLEEIEIKAPEKTIEESDPDDGEKSDDERPSDDDPFKGLSDIIAAPWLDW